MPVNTGNQFNIMESGLLSETVRRSTQFRFSSGASSTEKR